MSKLMTLWTFFTTKKKFNSREEIERNQQKKMLKHIKKIRNKSKFFSRHWDGFEDSQWRDFPLIDKSIMMENLQDYLTVNLDIDNAKNSALQAEKTRDFEQKTSGFTVGFSSGTSGSRGIHIVSKSEQEIWAGYMLARGLDGSIFGKHKIGLFLRANSNTYESIGSKNIKFQFYDLMRPLDELVKELYENKPDILIAPPSILRYLVDKKITLRFRKIVSTAEVLTPLDKSLIEEYFQCIVHQLYSSTEGEIATTCEFGTLHLNEDIMVIQKEYVDREKGQFFPIISDFKRITQPIIRYRLNDILVEKKEPCPCNDAREGIAEIIGRQDDVFILKNKNGDFEMIIPDLIRRAVLRLSGEIQAYMVEQISENEIIIQIQPDLKELNFTGFDELWKAKNIIEPKLKIIPYTFVPSAVKMRRISRKFDFNHNN